MKVFERLKDFLTGSYNEVSPVRKKLSAVSKAEGRIIKREYEKNEDLTMEDLAELYDIGSSTVNRIIQGDHWTTEDL